MRSLLLAVALVTASGSAAWLYIRAGADEPRIAVEETVVQREAENQEAARSRQWDGIGPGRPGGRQSVKEAESGTEKLKEPGLPKGHRPGIERQLEALLEQYSPPGAAVVLMEPATGRILAAVGRREDKPDRAHVMRPRYRAASIAKIVTLIGLYEAGLPADQEMCFHGGGRGLSLELLEDSPKLDTTCSNAMQALGKSQNVAFARWADRLLDRPRFLNMYSRLGFKSEPQLGWGWAEVPEGRLGLANLAAGFGQVRLSAWHGAVIASTIANKGRQPLSVGGRQVINPGVAQAVGYTMGQTVYAGTARKTFVVDGEFMLGDVDVAGKTGTISEGSGSSWREISWFVGFAPIDEPRVAVAAVVENRPHFKVRAHYLAMRALRMGL